MYSEYTFFVSLFVIFLLYTEAVDNLLFMKKVCTRWSMVSNLKKIGSTNVHISTANQTQFHSNRAGLIFFTHNKLPTAVLHSYGKK